MAISDWPAAERPRELLARFGGITKLLQADLTRVKGLGAAKRAQFAAAVEIARRSLGEDLGAGAALTSPGAVRDFLRLTLGPLEHEVFVCLWLDAQHRVIRTDESFRGTPPPNNGYPREIVKAALRANAAAVLFAHNPPSGIAQPSQADDGQDP